MNTRESDLPLADRLLNAPHGFDLFQAISLLEREGVAEGRVEIGASGGPEAVRLKSHVSLSFEASDVRNISRGAETGEAFTLSTPVLSLSGQGGPLPAAFTELLLERNAVKDFATSDFLDIIQHRLLSLFYLNRKRRRLGLGWASPQASTIARSTGYLCGHDVGNPDRQTHTPWLRHAGLIDRQEIGGNIHQARNVFGRILTALDQLQFRRVTVEFRKGDAFRQCANGILTAGR